jgi:O-antigen/teichoic acid export membrane protein
VFRDLTRHSLIYMLPTLLTRGLGVLLLPIYARAFAPEEYGVLDLIGTVGPFVHVLICLEVTQGYVRQRVDVEESVRPRLTGTSWLFSIVMYVVFLAVALPMGRMIATQFLGSARWGDAVIAGLFSISSQNLMNMFIGQFRWELRSREYSVLATIFAVTSVGSAAVLALGLNAGIVGILLGQTGAAVFVSALALPRLRSSWSWSFDVHLLSDMLRFSWPLVPASLAVFASMYANRYAINAFGTIAEVGIFGMGARLAGVVTLVTAAIQSSVTPLIYERYRDPGTPSELSRIFTTVVALSLTLCLALQTFASDIVLTLATREYLPSANIIGVMALALIINQLYAFTPGIAIAKRTVQQLGVTMCSAVVSVAANLALVPFFGAEGAAIATLGSAIVFFVVWAVVSQRHYPIPFEKGRLVLICGAYAAAFTTAASLLSHLAVLHPGVLVLKASLVLAFGAFVGATAVRRKPVLR